jgi:DNA topoisomerase-1
LLLKNKGGFYLEVERSPEEIERKDKPIWVSVPPGVDPRQLSQEELDVLSDMPRNIGKHPDSGEPILAKIGKFGAYVECGVERRTIEDWRSMLAMDVDAALVALSQPKGRPVRAAAAPLAEFGSLEGAEGPVRIMSGRFGPYVTDGTTNATLPRGLDPMTFSAEQAVELIIKKREAGPSTRPVRGKKPAAKSKAAPVVPAAAKASAAKAPSKATAKKPAATAKKPATKKSTKKP